LLGAVSRAARSLGSTDVASQISRTVDDIYHANASSRDLKKAAKGLGLTKDDLEECRNP
jgi:hypothetical protein